MPEADRGSYLVIEGSDGVGKTTQAAALAARLDSLGVACQRLVEPGATPIGQQIRLMLLDPELEKQPESELDLFMVARREMRHQIIEPQIARDTNLVSDRNWFSSVAYQGFGRGLEVSMIIEKAKQAMGDFFLPDGIVILDVPAEVAHERRVNRSGGADWIEKEAEVFFEKVRQGYYWLAEKFEVEVLDGTPAMPKVADEVFSRLGSLAVSK